MSEEPDTTVALDTLIAEAKTTKEIVNRTPAPSLVLVSGPELEGHIRDLERVILSAKWLADSIIDVLGEAQPCGFEPPRFAKELDSFELFGTMIARTDMRPLAAMLVRAVDDAEQLRFTCPECFKERGFFMERGFRRCKACGYPGQ